MASVQSELLRSSSNRKLVIAGQLAFLPTGILTTLLGPMLPILIARWAMNDTQAGNLFLVQFVAMLAGVQSSRVLLARWGFRPAILSGLLLMAFGVAALSTAAHSLGLISVAVYGLGLGMIIPTDNLLIAEISTGSGLTSRTGAVSLLNFFWGAGAVLCSVMVAWTAAHNLLPFFLCSVATFLVLLALAVRNLPFPPAAQSDELTISWRELVKSPAIWLFAAVFFLYPGVEAAVGGWSGSYVARLGPRGAEVASIMPAFFWSAMMLGRIFGLAMIAHVSERLVLPVGYGAAVVGIGVMLKSSTLEGVIAGTLIAGLSFALLYPISIGRFSERYGVAARSIGAVMFSLAAVGPAVIPWLVGVISHDTGSLRNGLLLPLGSTAILFLVHVFEW
ncbi:MAG: MFS transporter [Terriglobales bacterium]